MATAQAKDARKATADFIERVKNGAKAADILSAEIVYEQAELVRRGEWPPEITLARLWEVTGGAVDRSREVIRDLWLERGGGAFWISSSGTGKSVHSLQAAYAWSLGRPYFDITPSRPLRVAIVQSEDSVNEVLVTMAGMHAGYLAADGATWTAEDVNKAEESVVLWNANGATGKDFAAWLESKLQAAAESGRPVDLVVVNPFTSFYVGELNSLKDVNEFLKAQIDPVIKNADHGCALLIFHHTNKPATGSNNRAGYTDKGGYEEYIGAGSAALVNWARAVLVFLKKDKPGYFSLCAPKRGNALGWRDEEGNPTTQKIIRHAREGELVDGKRLPFWLAASKAEMDQSDAANGRQQAERVKAAAVAVANDIREATYAEVKGVTTAGEVDALARAHWGTKRGDGARAKETAVYVKTRFMELGLAHESQRVGNSTFEFYGTPSAVAELMARKPWAWNAATGRKG